LKETGSPSRRNKEQGKKKKPASGGSGGWGIDFNSFPQAALAEEEGQAKPSAVLVGKTDPRSGEREQNC